MTENGGGLRLYIQSPLIVLNEGDYGGDPSRASAVTITGSGIQKKTTTVMDDFRWNVEVDERLFSLDPPQSYEIERRTFEVGSGGESDLTDALKMWVELSGGGYPSDINDLGDEAVLTPVLITRFDGDDRPGDELAAAGKAAHVLIGGMYFAQERKVEGSWGYAGERVDPGDAEAPLCWWKIEETDKYRVVYGDLHIGELDLEELEKRLK